MRPAFFVDERMDFVVRPPRKRPMAWLFSPLLRQQLSDGP